MLEFLDSISFQYLIIVTVLMALAPFQPEPHLIEKLRMLEEGILVRPIDIFDLFFHLVPAIVLILKVVREYFIK